MASTILRLYSGEVTFLLGLLQEVKQHWRNIGRTELLLAEIDVELSHLEMW
jgi:hypothetical protein